MSGPFPDPGASRVYPGLQSLTRLPVSSTPAPNSSRDVLPSSDRVLHRICIHGQVLYINADTFRNMTHGHRHSNGRLAASRASDSGHDQGSTLFRAHTNPPAAQPTPTKISDRPMLRATEIVFDNKICSGVIEHLRAQHLVDALHSRAAYIAYIALPIFNGVPASAVANTTQAAGYRMKLIDSSGVQLPPCWVADLLDGWRAIVPVPNGFEELQSERQAIRSWCPPEGLLRMAICGGITMTHFDVQGPSDHVHSRTARPMVDIRQLDDTEVSALELLIFFPTHVGHWPNFVGRLYASGWTATHIARTANRARNAHDGVNGIKSKSVHDAAKRLSSNSSNASFTCGAWTPPKTLAMMDYFIRDLAAGVARFAFPEGRHRGPLTQIIEEVLDRTELHDCMLSNIKLLVNGTRHDLSFLSHQIPEDRSPVEDALEDLQPALEAYRVGFAARSRT